MHVNWYLNDGKGAIWWLRKHRFYFRVFAIEWEKISKKKTLFDWFRQFMCTLVWLRLNLKRTKVPIEMTQLTLYSNRIQDIFFSRTLLLQFPDNFWGWPLKERTKNVYCISWSSSCQPTYFFFLIRLLFFFFFFWFSSTSSAFRKIITAMCVQKWRQKFCVLDECIARDEEITTKNRITTKINTQKPFIHGTIWKTKTFSTFYYNSTTFISNIFGNIGIPYI